MENAGEAALPARSIVNGEPFGPRVCHIGEQAEAESSDDEPESESDDEGRFQKDESNELPPEFWHMQKLIKYTKAGNQTATTVALCLLKDCELRSRVGYKKLIYSTKITYFSYIKMQINVGKNNRMKVLLNLGALIGN